MATTLMATVLLTWKLRHQARHGNAAQLLIGDGERTLFGSVGRLPRQEPRETQVGSGA